MKEKGDKKGDKASENEQGLTCHKLEGRQGSELGFSVAYPSVYLLWSVRPYSL